MVPYSQDEIAEMIRNFLIQNREESINVIAHSLKNEEQVATMALAYARAKDVYDEASIKFELAYGVKDTSSSGMEFLACYIGFNGGVDMVTVFGVFRSNAKEMELWPPAEKRQVLQISDRRERLVR